MLQLFESLDIERIECWEGFETETYCGKFDIGTSKRLDTMFDGVEDVYEWWRPEHKEALADTGDAAALGTWTYKRKDGLNEWWREYVIDGMQLLRVSVWLSVKRVAVVFE